MEVVCTHMFLTGAAKRQRDDWQEILLSTSLSSSSSSFLFITIHFCPSRPLAHFPLRLHRGWSHMHRELIIRPTIPIRLQHRIRYRLQLLPKRDSLQLSRINKGYYPPNSRFSRFRDERYNRIEQRFRYCKASQGGCSEGCGGHF
jgi:hypothetical protein